MRKTLAFPSSVKAGLTLLAALLLSPPSAHVRASALSPADARDPAGDVGSPASPAPSAGLRCLLAAYPDHLERAEGNVVIWRDGTRMPYDDGRAKPDHDSLLDEADLQDQMAMRYPRGGHYPDPMPPNFEPGRVRHEPFFRKMYGADREDVRRRLRKIRWLPSYIGERTVWATTVNGVADKLERISDELEVLGRKDEVVARCLSVFSGTFNWRLIKGTARASTHSFGIAVDIHAKAPFGRYWKWGYRGPERPLSYANEFPLSIVEVFERHGFIWGGKWYHFDTPHFEYRPELLQEGCVIRSESPSFLSEGAE